MAGLYLPQSDCECYYQALDLLNDALAPIDARITNIEGESKVYNGQSYEEKPSGVPDGSVYFELDTGKEYCYYGDQWNEIPCCGGGTPSESNYIYLNDWLTENACAGYPHGPDYLAELVESGKKLIYFNSADGNLYISNGAINYDDLVPKTYFSIYPQCEEEANLDSGAYFGAEFSFYTTSSFGGNLRPLLMNVDDDMSSEESDGFIPSVGDFGILRYINGQTVRPEHIDHLYAIGYTPTFLCGPTVFATLSVPSTADGTTCPVLVNGQPLSISDPCFKVREYTHSGDQLKLLVYNLPQPI